MFSKLAFVTQLSIAVAHICYHLSRAPVWSTPWRADSILTRSAAMSRMLVSCTSQARAAARCRFDHIFGNFRTEAGRVRRLDVIIAPAEECHFCVLGWSGSRQYLRFLRQWAVDLGMHLNSHRRARFRCRVVRHAPSRNASSDMRPYRGS